MDCGRLPQPFARRGRQLASIFLSYAREDLGKAERLAEALNAAGHAVWWDRHLHAGARFSKEIDEALKSADLIVVLWSSASIESTWVHDEAAAGRDTGRLVPVLIERVEPPLGFRQYQSVALGRRRGANEFKPLIDALAKRTGDPFASPPTVAPNARRGAPKPYLVAGVVTALFLAVTVWFLDPFSNAPSNSVAITPTGVDTRQSTELARTIVLDLGRYRGGALGSLSIISANEPGASKAEYRVGVGLSGSDHDWSADLTLQSRQNSRLLWTTSLKGQETKLVDLRQQAVSMLVDVLGCLKESQEAGARISDEGRALYLQGCGMLSDVNTDEPNEEILSIFRQLTERAPTFAPGWGNLALLEVQSWPSAPPQEHKALMRRAREHLSRARRIDPTSPIVFAADASLPEHQKPAMALTILERGLKLHPDNALLHGFRAYFLAGTGRTNESVGENLKAMQLNPLSPSFRDQYLSALAYSGRTTKAFNELNEAEAIWPGSEVLRQARYRLDLRYGDPRAALRLLEEKGAGDARAIPMDTAWKAFIEARIDPNPANVEKALEAFRARYRRNHDDIWGYVQALGTFGRVDEALQALEPAEAFDSASASPDTFFRVHMWPILSDPRFLRVAQRLGLLQYWEKSGIWPDFCSDPKLPYDCHKEAAKFR